MKPTPGDVHVNAVLTNISVAYMQNAANFVAARVFPNVPVTKQSDRYYIYDRGYFNRDEMKVRAPGTESAGSGFAVDNTPNYFAPVYAFHHDIDEQRRANSDSVLAPDREATELVTLKGLIKRETSWVAKYFIGGVWTGGDIDGAAVPAPPQVLHWSDANSDPIKNIRTAISTVLESTGFEPNTLVLGFPVYNALIDHPDIVDRVKYGQTAGSIAQVSTSDLAALFKVPNIYVMKSIQNTAAEGAANVHSFIGGKKALLCYAAPSPALMTPSAGYTFSWNGYLGAANDGQRISKFYMQNLKADRVEIEMAFDQKVVSSDLGYFWDTIVA